MLGRQKCTLSRYSGQVIWGVLKSKDVFRQGSCRIRAGREASSLSFEVARQLQHAKFYERIRFRRYVARGRWLSGNREERSDRTAAGCDGRLVSAEELFAERCEAGGHDTLDLPGFCVVQSERSAVLRVRSSQGNRDRSTRWVICSRGRPSASEVTSVRISERDLESCARFVNCLYCKCKYQRHSLTAGASSTRRRVLEPQWERAATTRKAPR
jgi:hypothetical protein